MVARTIAERDAGASKTKGGSASENKVSQMDGQSVPLRHLAILEEIRSAQAAHGLKNNSDFLRYRRYCTRRLSRVRRAAHIQNGRGRYNAHPITVPSVHADERSLLVPLYSAERAWAFAMDVKRERPAGPARARRTVISKLAKAVLHAELLRTLCKQTADEETVLEAEAYAKWMTATLALEKELWGKALAAFEIAHRIYGGMAGVTSGTAKSGVFEEKVEEIAQAMRFCKYNLARDGGDGMDDGELLRDMLEAGVNTDDVLAEKIEAALAAARKRTAQSFGEIEWCGKSIPLRSEHVREAVLAATEESAALRSALSSASTNNGADDTTGISRAKSQQSSAVSIDMYDKVFMAYNDAVRIVNKELSEFRGATAARAEDRIAELEYIVAYLTYGRLTHTVERNVLLVASFRSKKNAKPEDFVRLYDNLIQNMSDILALQGVDEDAVVSNDAEAKRTLYRAYRCFHLARCYLFAGMQGEAALLFDRVSTHANAIAGKYSEEAQAIVREGAGLKFRARAQAYLNEAQVARKLGSLSVDAGATGRRRTFMTDNLDSFESYARDPTGTHRIAELPPALEAVSCKPVLFDLAVDGIKFPDKPQEEKPAEEQDAAKPVGAFGAMQSTRLGRWLSGTR